jgi:hypothetical protein
MAWRLKMSEEVFNPKVEIEKLCDEHKIFFTRKGSITHEDLIAVGLGNILYDKLLQFVSKKEFNGYYILEVHNPETKQEYRLEIKNEGGEEPKKAEKIEKKEIVHSKDGKLISSVAEEIVEVLKDKYNLFYRVDSKDIVEIGMVNDKKEVSSFTGFLQERPNRFITQIENYCIPVVEVYSPKFKMNMSIPKSISSELANTILCSSILQNGLPKIKRIFTIPMPILYEGKLTYSKKGYDDRFESWMPFDTPEITNPDMSIKEAKEILENKIFGEFCFETPKDKITAIAGLITPALRGLYSRFSVRTPLMFYIGNRERAGKDYLAGITGIVYEGFPFEEPPISTSENAKSNNTDEVRKKILASMIYGRKRFHSSNNKGFINNAVFESVLTAEKYVDRILGRSENLSFDNEIDYSLSGNVGIGFTPDLANRSKFIRLFLDIEDANSREFETPNLHNWIKENRGLVLSAIHTLIRNWVDNGMPKGKIPFTSFPEWAGICGGILESAGWENVCGSDTSAISLGVDTETADMKTLFEIGYEKHPEEWINKNTLRELIFGQDVFNYLNLNERPDQVKLGNKINKFIGRVLSDVRLIVKDSSVRSSRQELKFTKEVGNLGNLGNLRTTHRPLSKELVSNRETLPTLPTLPQFTPEQIKSCGFTPEELNEVSKDEN